ncbi:Arm DNA-binding domain-containing protein [Brevibacillus invocatus]|uniref:Arm DNA-binding domain-containing protein n=1 Tax=Brevibacillus invocatus TaxID=173959 RepID=UPI0039A20722
MRGTVQRKGNKWYTVLYTGKDELTGKWNRKWFSGFKTKKEAERFLRRRSPRLHKADIQSPPRNRSANIWKHGWKIKSCR